MEHWSILNRTSYSGGHSGSTLKQCQNPSKKTLLAHQNPPMTKLVGFKKLHLGALGLKSWFCNFWTIFEKHRISVVRTPKRNFAQR